MDNSSLDQTESRPVTPATWLRERMLPRTLFWSLPTAPSRPTAPRGSILILVVAVLVLLALMGTAYISSSRSGREASIVSSSTASVDVLADSVVGRLKGDLVSDKVRTPASVGMTLRNVATGFLSYHRQTTSLITLPSREEGLQYLASRTPYAVDNAADNVPRWEFLSAPLEASPSIAGAFFSPIVDTASSGTSKLIGQNTWGTTEGARRNMEISSYIWNNTRYPAFYLGAAIDRWVIAADADGDGIADSGYSYLGTLGNPAYAGVNFYVGVRVIDNNSAINVNTAWTNGDDLDFSGPPAPVRNNRLFPAAVGLKETLTPPSNGGFAGAGGLPTGNYNTLENFEADAANQDFLAYRNGYFGKTGVTMNNHGRPRMDFEFASERPIDTSLTAAGAWRDDFIFNTQQELTWASMARRLYFPGSHGDYGVAGASYPFTPFTLGDQAELAYGFILAPRNTGDLTWSAARARRPYLEQILSYSLYRVADLSGSTWPASWTAAVPPMRSTPYQPNQFGVRNDATITAGTWFEENFNYDATGGSGNTSNALNLRPLLVAHNPVTESAPFKPLPAQAIPQTDTVSYRYDRMNPYVKIWRDPSNTFSIAGTAAEQRYNPGDIVYYATNGTDGRYYINSTNGQINPPTTPNTAGSGWTEYTGPIVPTKVDVNTADFGDLWRAFYGVMAGTLSPNPALNDVIDPANRPASVSPYGTYTQPTSNAIANQGMEYASGGPSAQDPITPGAHNIHRMFRSSMRGPDAHLTNLGPDQMVLLRSAQAAVNAEYLRSFNGMARDNAGAVVNPGVIADVVPKRLIRLEATIANTSNSAVTAHVYAAPRGVYISEVYVNTSGVYTITDTTHNPDSLNNPGGYIAVELYNPYPFPISLQNWRLEVLDRTAPATVLGGRALTTLATFNAAAIVPANGTLVIHNAPGPAGAAAASGITPNGASAPPRDGGTALTTTGALNVPGLEQAFNGTNGGELIISRPRVGQIDSTNGLTCPVAPIDVNDYVPVDSIDLTAARTDGGLADTTANYWSYHYARRGDGWNFVYPGRYYTDTVAATTRQQGLRRNTEAFAATTPAAVGFSNPPVGFGAVGLTPASATYGGTAGAPSAPGQFPIQIANIGFGGPNGALASSTVTPANRFPFGGFLRELDILQIPFISPVRMQGTGLTPTYEVLTTTSDAAMAEDTYTDDNAEENIGRFTPIVGPAAVNALPDAAFIDGGTPATVVDEHLQRAGSTAVDNVRYGWAHKLLDYVTVRPAGKKSLPMTAMRRIHNSNAPVSPDNAPLSVASYPQPDTTGSAYNPIQPQLVPDRPSDFGGAGTSSPYDAGTEGLVNINTAPLPVLAAIPWSAVIPPALGPVTAVELAEARQRNVLVAKSIIAHRQKRGPFRSIFDLNAVRMVNLAGAEQTYSLRTFVGDPTTPVLDPPAGGSAGYSSSFDQTVFGTRLTNDNGDFTPIADSGGAMTDPHSIVNRGVPDPAFPGAPGNKNTDNSTYTAATNTNNNRNPAGDFESQFLMINGVSNLITTKSDTFTAYVVIEGWENAGTVNAKRVLQRRYAYILDRTGVAVGLPQGNNNALPAPTFRPFYDPTNIPNSAVVNPAPIVGVNPVAVPRSLYSDVKVNQIATPPAQ